jgi:hypothetical protein
MNLKNIEKILAGTECKKMLRDRKNVLNSDNDDNDDECDEDEVEVLDGPDASSLIDGSVDDYSVQDDEQEVGASTSSPGRRQPKILFSSLEDYAISEAMRHHEYGSWNKIANECGERLHEIHRKGSSVKDRVRAILKNPTLSAKLFSGLPYEAWKNRDR